MDAPRPLVIAHRGASAQARDNTVEAFRLAVAAGADGVELDVRYSADRRLILHHDPTVEGFGVLFEHTLDEIRAALPWMATLEEAFDVLGELLVDIEIKNTPTHPDYDPEQQIARDVVDFVRDRGVERRVWLTSFNPLTIDEVKRSAEELPTGMLFYEGIDPVPVLADVAAGGHRLIGPHVGQLGRRRAKWLVEQAAAHGLEVVPWTVNGAREVRRMGRAGVAGVITDDPGEALRALGRSSGGLAAD